MNICCMMRFYKYEHLFIWNNFVNAIYVKTNASRQPCCGRHEVNTLRLTRDLTGAAGNSCVGIIFFFHVLQLFAEVTTHFLMFFNK